MSNDGKKKVLVVDDEKLVTNMIVSTLDRLGIHSIAAGDGVEAVEKFRDNHNALSLVILDVNMPKMGGKEALAKMHEIDAQVPILVSSGFNEGGILSDSESAMASGTLVKPYNGETLIEAIQEAIAD
jgi:CheY-like chemotaxis protein